MKEIDKLAKEALDPHFINEFEGYDLSEEEVFAMGFRKAREMAADLLDHALKWACIEVDQHDRTTLEHQVTRIRQIGETEQA